MTSSPSPSPSRFGPEVMPWNDDFVTHRYVKLEHVRLHVVEAGEGPLVVLLHGLLGFWYSWRFQIPVLVRQGFRVVAPDMRGYNLSDKPSAMRAYRVERLVDDVVELVERLDEPRAAVVGHDWGGMVGWWFGMRHPQRLSRLAVLNAPHPGHPLAMMRGRSPLRTALYMLAFQLPLWPERVLMRNDGELLRAVFRDEPEREGAFTEADIDRYVRAMSGGTVRAILHHSRAQLRRNPFATRRAVRPVSRPVQILWGARDTLLDAQHARPVDSSLAPHLRMDIIDDASHWVQVDRPAKVNARLKEFLHPLGPSRIV